MSEYKTWQEKDGGDKLLGLAILVIAFLCFMAAASAACNSSALSFYKPVNITSSVGTINANYQTLLNVSYVSGKMNADFSDLCFANTTGHDLSFWIENYSANSWALVWVKVESTIPNSGTIVNMYYGNSSATSNSSANNTWDWTYNANVLPENDSYSRSTFGSGSAVYEINPAGEFHQKVTVAGDFDWDTRTVGTGTMNGTRQMIRAKWDSCTVADTFWLMTMQDGANWESASCHNATAMNNYENGSWVTYGQPTGVTFNTYNNFFIKNYHGTNGSEFRINEISQHNYTYTSTALKQTQIGMSGTASGTVEMHIDYIFGSNKSVATEPTAVFGAEISGYVTWNNPVRALDTTPFYGTSTATAWYYDFNNDGSIEAVTQNTTYNFTTNGTKTLNMTATIGGTNYTLLYHPIAYYAPTPNFTIANSLPYMAATSLQFNDTSTDIGGQKPITAWAWDFNDTNTSSTQNATHTFAMPNYYYVCLNVSNAQGVWALAKTCRNLTINGFALDVYNEKTWAAVTNWNTTISNSTYTVSFTTQNNTLTWPNFTSFPTGAITVSVIASGYLGRNYYRTYNLASPLYLHAYLLDSSSGIYSYFLTQDTYSNIVGSVSLVFSFANGTSTVTAGEALTDATGSTSMWLDWTKTYTLTASKTGYTTVSKTITPMATTYIVVLGSGSIFNYTYQNSSLWTFMSPTNPSVNATTATIQSGVLDPNSGISICGLNLTYTNGTVFNSTNDTTQQHFCVNTIPLLGSGLGSQTKFYAVQWFTYNGTSFNGTRTYTVLNGNNTLNNAQVNLYNYLGGKEARLMLVVIVTLFAGAASAAYIGSGAVIIMIVVSGLFAIWGWFGTGALLGLYAIAATAGLVVFYLETRM